MVYSSAYWAHSLIEHKNTVCGSNSARARHIQDGSSTHWHLKKGAVSSVRVLQQLFACRGDCGRQLAVVTHGCHSQMLPVWATHTCYTWSRGYMASCLKCPVYVKDWGAGNECCWQHSYGTGSMKLSGCLSRLNGPTEWILIPDIGLIPLKYKRIRSCFQWF